MTYEEELRDLSSQVGGRNRRLLAIALKGRDAGREAEQMVAEIVAASGIPPLTTAEVRRAVVRAMALPGRTPSRQTFVPQYRAEKRRGNPRLSALLKSSAVPSQAPARSTSGYSFVREMIDAGGGTATSAELKALSPRPIHAKPWVQAMHFCLMLDEPDAGLFFLGTPQTPRTREHLHELTEVEVGLMDHPTAIPTHILPNGLTGEGVSDGKGGLSYAREACVCHTQNTVVEFDEMPLAVQAAFWKGVIISGLLPLRALVYSGGKSIHGLLRLESGKDFKTQWRVLERALANDSDKRYHCDLSFRSPVQMMRMPGALRPETGRRQSLLYLDDALPRVARATSEALVHV